MRVLLTGHQGYLGTVMAPILTAAGHEVTGLDSGLFAACILGGLDTPDVPGLAVDLRDVTVDQLAGFDAVVHMAALSNDPLGSLAPEITYDVNHHASTRLARLAKERASAASSTPPRARCTGRSPATSSSTRTRRSSRSRRTRSRRSASRTT